MKRKKWIAGSVIAGGLVLVVNVYTATLPDYGVRSKWKKLLLKTLLSDEVPKISVSDALAIKDSVLFVDTREPDEYLVSHVKDAVLAGSKHLDLALLNHIPKDQPIIIYCSIGKRSDVVAKKLIAAGYSSVQNLYGGIFEWINKGYPVVDNNNQPTDKIHPFSSVWGRWLNRGKKVY